MSPNLLFSYFYSCSWKQRYFFEYFLLTESTSSVLTTGISFVNDFWLFSSLSSPSEGCVYSIVGVSILTISTDFWISSAFSSCILSSSVDLTTLSVVEILVWSCSSLKKYQNILKYYSMNIVKYNIRYIIGLLIVEFWLLNYGISLNEFTENFGKYHKLLVKLLCKSNYILCNYYAYYAIKSNKVQFLYYRVSSFSKCPNNGTFPWRNITLAHSAIYIPFYHFPFLVGQALCVLPKIPKFALA